VLGEELAEWTGARCLAASGLSCSATPARAIASSSFGPWESPTRSRLAGARWLAGASPAPSRTFRRIRAQHARTRRRHRIVIASHPPLGSSSLLPACKRARWRSRPRRPHRTSSSSPASASIGCPFAAIPAARRRGRIKGRRRRERPLCPGDRTSGKPVVVAGAMPAAPLRLKRPRRSRDRSAQEAGVFPGQPGWPLFAHCRSGPPVRLGVS
jgi:hypothetical protein